MTQIPLPDENTLKADDKSIIHEVIGLLTVNPFPVSVAWIMRLKAIANNMEFGTHSGSTMTDQTLKLIKDGLKNNE